MNVNTEDQLIQKGILSERRRILNAIVELENRSHETRTPIYQDTFFKYVKSVISDQHHPPLRFRDAGNGE